MNLGPSNMPILRVLGPEHQAFLAPDESMCITPTKGSATRLKTALMTCAGSEATGTRQCDHSQGEAG